LREISFLKTAPPLPFLSGVYSTGPGLVPLSKNGLPDNRVFDIDNNYEAYLANKSECRNHLTKHFCTEKFQPATEAAACRFIAKELSRGYPNIFKFSDEGEQVLENKTTGDALRWRENTLPSRGKYMSLFDAISNQVQEDLAVFQLEDTSDWLAAIHLCSPNHWDPRDKVGRPFPEIHSPVPAMERTVSQYKPMLQSVISKGPFARYAWGIDRDDKLNHHPHGPNEGGAASDKYFIRMERQHLVGLPEVNAFLFTIRTYLLDVDSLNGEERAALASAVRSMSPASLKYKRMDGYVEKLLERISTK
jgi:hypothetical protein